MANPFVEDEIIEKLNVDPSLPLIDIMLPLSSPALINNFL
jgi:hypothetical protein